jgi:hypothetical protein
MPRELVKKASLASIEAILQSVMPELTARLDHLDHRFDELHRQFEQFKDETRKELAGFQVTTTAKIGALAIELRKEMDILGTGLRQEIFDRYEQTRDLINEPAQRHSKIGGAMEYLGSAIMDNNRAIYALLPQMRMASSRPGRRKAG